MQTNRSANMEVFLKRILLCILLTTSTESKTYLIKDIAEYVYNVFTLGLDLSDRLDSNDKLDKVLESVHKLNDSIQKIHKMLHYTKQLVEDVHHLIRVQSYVNKLNEHIEEIDKCNTDLQFVLTNPTDMVGRENLKECYNIMINVQTIGFYLSGKPLLNSKPLFDLFNNDDGTCNGEDIEQIYRSLYVKFFDGCIIISAAERMKHINSTIYKDRCWEMNKNISAYMRFFYGKCINKSCSSFHSRVSALLENLERIDSSTVFNALQRNYPWLQLNVIQVGTKEAEVENDSSFFLHSGMFVVQHKIIHLFWTDVFVMFSKNRTNRNQATVNITISYRDFESWFLGMNLSHENPLETKRISAFGYTSDQSIDTCKYLPGSDDSLPVTPNSENRLRTPALIFVSIIFLELLKSLCYF